ncbi:MAG TPA: hypothetical protein VGG34_05450 [Opitutaceae bacterium]|jgi:hypothetical protein
MLRKNKAEGKGPSWTEVILAALLSAVVGLLGAVAFLVEKPVKAVKEIPKDAPSNAVFYVAGSTDVNQTSVAEVRRSFLSGVTVELTEGELNAYLSSISKPSSPAPAKPGEKGAPAADQGGIVPGTLNARIADGRLQLADPVSISYFGVSTSVIVQATGTIERDGSQWVFDAEKVLVGGLQVQRIPFLKGFVLGRLVLAQDVPSDVAAAWSRLAAVSIEGAKLRLKAQ